MGNSEHILLLKEGVEKWNEWREAHPNVKPDLSKGNFIGTNLRKANLSNSDLTSAKLTGANLIEANLANSSCHGADLSADFSYANLSQADLSYASIINSKFIGSNLRWTNFYSVLMHGGVFVSTNLSEAIELDSIMHLGPSKIDLNTLYHSKGNIPASFLSSIGIPIDFINHLYSYKKEPSVYYSCFISYSSKDEAFAKRLHRDLLNEGVECWYAPKDMKIGDKIRQTIDESIQKQEKLLIILSENSIESDWVEKEVETAFEEERKNKCTVFLPIKLDKSVMDTDKAWASDIRRSRHIGDFTKWQHPSNYKEPFIALLDALKK